jgi:hypothetical protein
VRVELGDRHRPAEQIALYQVDACRPQVFELFFGLDALSGRHGAEPLRERKRRGNDGLAVTAIEHALGERLVDLDLVERKVRQIIHGRISGAEIIERHGYSEILDLADGGQMGFLVFKKRGFGYLELQPVRRKTRLHQRTQQDLEEVALLELNGRDIDRQLDVGGPRSSIGASALQDPFSQRPNKAGRFRERNELVRRNHPLGRVAPSDQSLNAAKRSRLRIHNGLVMQFEFAPLDGVSQLALRRALRIGNFKKLVSEEPEIVPATGLDVVERKVGSLQQPLRIDAHAPAPKRYRCWCQGWPDCR